MHLGKGMTNAQYCLHNNKKQFDAQLGQDDCAQPCAAYMGQHILGMQKHRLGSRCTCAMATLLQLMSHPLGGRILDMPPDVKYVKEGHEGNVRKQYDCYEFLVGITLLGCQHLVRGFQSLLDRLRLNGTCPSMTPGRHSQGYGRRELSCEVNERPARACWHPCKANAGMLELCEQLYCHVS